MQALTFQPPAQLGGSLNGTGEWGLFIFDGQDAAFDAQVAGPIQHDNVTESETHLDGYGFNATQPVPGQDAPSTLEALQARVAFPGRPGSLYVEAQSLRVVATGTSGILQPKAATSCLRFLLRDGEAERHLAREHCDHHDDAAVRADVPPDGATVSFQVVAEGVTQMEWHGAKVSCAGSPCPGGGGAELTTLPLPMGRSVTVASYTYEAFNATGGSLMGSGSAAAVLWGGRDMSLGLDGWVRLPDPHLLEACSTCIDPANHTLWARGHVELLDLAPAGRGMATRFGGNLSALYLDELAVPKDRLQSVGWAVAAGTAAAGAVGYLLYKVIAAGLFTRLFEDRALRNPRRKLIHEYVQEHPGVTLRELSRATGIPRTSLRTHATILIRGRLLTEVEGRGSHRFFTTKAAPAGWQKAALLREETLQTLFRWLEQRPGIQQKEALDHAEAAWGWQRATTRYRLAKLVEGGLLATRKEGKERTYTAA